MTEELNSFAASLIEDTQLEMDVYQTPEMAFTATVLNSIEDLLDCKEITIEHCRLTNKAGNITGELHAYAESTNEEVLYLFYTDYNPRHDVQFKNSTDCQASLNRPQGFYNAAIRGVHFDLDESTAEYRAGEFIYSNLAKYKSINIVILSNYIIKNLNIKKHRIAAKPLYHEVWDLNKLYGNTHSLNDHVAINIDFESDEYKRYRIPFIQMESTQCGYRCVQMLFPAKLLYNLYEHYNTKLLYSNVRYFLGLKGSKESKPNVAMLDTLRRENEMFLAYNNGITALAKGIESLSVGEKENVTDPESTTSQQYITMGVLKKILDFRIINGGQTTAAIFNAKNLSNETKDPSKKVTLSGVFVQVKLIISDDIEKLAGNIALSSNFQNKIKYSDFSVGNEFNVKIEKLSRGIVIPNANNEPIYWFYERLRGQYDETKKPLKTKIDREMFDIRYPKQKKFTKEDVAKVWTNWNQTPYDAVKGASTTYSIFMKSQVERSFIPDEDFYKKTIALLIIYKFLMSRPENRSYANAKATVVAYAIAQLEYLTLGQFDLLKVWKNQEVSIETKAFLNSICEKIYSLLLERAESTNTTILSYGKTKSAYDYIKSQPLGVDIHLLDNDRI